LFNAFLNKLLPTCKFDLYSHTLWACIWFPCMMDEFFISLESETYKQKAIWFEILPVFFVHWLQTLLVFVACLLDDLFTLYISIHLSSHFIGIYGFQRWINFVKEITCFYFGHNLKVNFDSVLNTPCCFVLIILWM